MLELKPLLQLLSIIYLELKKLFEPTIGGGLDLLNYKVSLEDLNAQNHMYHAAWWMDILTCMQVVISAIGVYLVVETLKDTRASAEAAMKAVEVSRHGTVGQLRPWVRLIENKLSFHTDDVPFEPDDNELCVGSVEVEIENRGASPATDVRIAVHHFPESKCYEALDEYATISPEFYEDRLSATLFPNECMRVDVPLAYAKEELQNPEWRMQGAIAVFIRYGYTGSESRFETRQLFWVHKVKHKTIRIEEDFGETETRFFRLEPATKPLLT
ncbi:hypothetical protein SH501x_001414 [Pirellulaceae bacterium SH501]